MSLIRAAMVAHFRASGDATLRRTVIHGIHRHERLRSGNALRFPMEHGNEVEAMTQRSFLARVWYNLCWWPCWAFAKVWFRYRWSGAEHVPMRGPVLVVCNHQSHLDPVLVGVACPRQLCYLARHTLFFWPLGWLIRSLGAVPIDRSSGRGGIKTTLKLLKESEAVLMFPEGTRSPDGRLQPLLPGFCALARRSEATILPVTLDGAYRAMPRGSGLPRPNRIRLVFSESIIAAEYAGLSDGELAEVVTERIRLGIERVAKI